MELHSLYSELLQNLNPSLYKTVTANQAIITMAKVIKITWIKKLDGRAFPPQNFHDYLDLKVKVLKNAIG